MKRKIALWVTFLLILQSLFLPLNVLAVPAAPGRLTAVVINARQANLSWVDNSADETDFRLERADDAGFTAGLRNIKVKASPGVGSTVTVSDGGVAAERTFFYRVFALNRDGDSPPSPTVRVTVAVPAAPSGLTAVADGPTQVTLRWVDNATDETSYDVDRSLTADFAVRISVEFLPPNTTTFVDTTVQQGTTYFYRVQAVSGVGDSPVSNVVSVTTPVPGVPAAPTGLSARVISVNRVDLTWVDNAVDETGYHLERAPDATFTALTHIALPANSSSFSDTTVSANQTVFYRIHALNSVGESPLSNIVQVLVTPPASPAPAPVTTAPPPATGGAAVTGGGGGGAAGGASVAAVSITPQAVSGLTLPLTLSLDPTGTVLNASAVKLESNDGKVSLTIASGTRMLGANGSALASLSLSSVSTPPSAP
ncbi:MAG: fibronectin type III domain-containing protein, partial [Chloroflexi bacterium]|nr:fibronectin type III domain-containing protein [Chloroflexota bacterium]